jgi:hypothetical protein
VERTVARLLGVQFDLPRLSEGVGLHEVTFLVDVEPVLYGVVLEVGDETWDVDGSQAGVLEC